VAAVYDGVHQTPDYQDEGVMFLSVENIDTLKSQKFISEEAFIRDYPVYPERGDVLMTRIGDIGTSNVVETDDKLAFYVSLALLKPFDIDPYYLDKSLQSPSAREELFKRTLHIAFPKKINKNQIAEVLLPIPKSRDEQIQIGRLFRILDNLITLHQREFSLPYCGIPIPLVPSIRRESPCKHYRGERCLTNYPATTCSATTTRNGSPFTRRTQ
jgi:type I restriction enzyme S subunit